MLKRISLVLAFILSLTLMPALAVSEGTENEGEKKKYIKWVDFTPSYTVLAKALELDIKTHEEEPHLPWIETLAYLAAKCGGDFSKSRDKELDSFIKMRRDGESIESIVEKLKYYAYYFEAYTAILGEFVGEYFINTSEDRQKEVWEKRYGLKVFSPIAKDFPYAHYNDFGVGRNYGYKRRHLGHDMMAATGTPIIAVESGIVEAIGWNQYGGWRIGIRSFDQKRYYYYAHLRKNRPFHADLALGKTVKAGDVIGYVGRSGYSKTENTNNIDESHLHFGMQIIFNESQKEGPGEIWIDAYAITKLLEKNKCATYRVDETKEFYRKIDFNEALLENHLKKSENSENTTGPIEYTESDEVKVPIIMYHNVSKNPELLGKFTITPYELEEDLAAMEKLGMTAVTVSEVIDYVYYGANLPERPVMLTFDDGNFSDYRYVFPLLKKYNQKAVMSVIGSVTDKYSEDAAEVSMNYPNLTWSQIKEMQDSGLVEIQSHSYNMHGPLGSQKRSGENEEGYKARFTADLTALQKRSEEMLNWTPTAFTYPFGIMGRGSTVMLKQMGFKASFSCAEGINTIKRHEYDALFRLKRYIRPHGKAAIEILRK